MPRQVMPTCSKVERGPECVEFHHPAGLFIRIEGKKMFLSFIGAGVDFTFPVTRVELANYMDAFSETIAVASIFSHAGDNDDDEEDI